MSLLAYITGLRAGIQNAASTTELSLAWTAFKSEESPETAMAWMGKLLSLGADLATPAAGSASTSVGAAGSITYLYFSVLPRAKKELTETGKISGGTAKDLVDAAAAFGSKIPYLGPLLTAYSLCSAIATLTESTAFSEDAAYALNTLIGANPDGFAAYSAFVANPDQANNWFTFDKTRVYGEIMANIDLPRAISLASAGDKLSQYFLLTRRTVDESDVNFIAYQSDERPLLFWQQSAVLFKAELGEYIFGESSWTQESAEFLHGVYKTGDGPITDDHAVGVSWVNPEWLTLPNVLFGTNSDSASIFLKNTYWGTTQNNVFAGGSQGDSIQGFDGNDTLIGNGGNDHIEGGDGHDVIDGGVGTDTLVGGKGNDWLGYTAANTTAGSASEFNSSGNIYEGNAGDDQLYGSLGADTVRLRPGDGKDIFRSHGGADTIEFLGGLDLDSPNTQIDRVMADLRITFADGTTITIKDWETQGELMAFFNGVTGTTTGFDAMSARVKRFFGDGTDNVYEVGTSTGQKVYGSGGNDSLTGSSSADLIDGGDGVDVITGNAGDDQLWGQAGNDRLYGGADNDRIYGGAGEDTLFGDDGHDMLAGGDNADQAFGGSGRDEIWGGEGNDSLHGNDDNDSLYGEADADTLKGGGGSNLMVGGTGNDEFFAEGTRDEMWGGGDFDTYRLTPTGASTLKVIFEDAQGGSVDLSAYAQAGVGLHLLRNSADQLVLTTSQSETIVVNGWSQQSTSLVVGNQTWGHARVQSALSEKYGYTYNNIYKASQFASVVASLSPTFSAAVALYGETAVQSVFGDGLAQGTVMSHTIDGATVLRWGWKAGTLSDEALSQGATYVGTPLTLFENGRTRSAAFLSLPSTVTDTTPGERVDLWYDCWNDAIEGWRFAAVEAYSAQTDTAKLNPDNTITASAEFGRVVNRHDPATMGLVHAERNNFQLLAVQ